MNWKIPCTKLNLISSSRGLGGVTPSSMASGCWRLPKPKRFGRKLSTIPVFKKQIGPVTLLYTPDFSIGATVLLSRFEKNLFSITVGPTNEDVEVSNEFAMMVELGFFVLTGERYQMVIPTKLNMGKVKRAASKFARTEDADGVLHPEYLVATMSYARAQRMANPPTSNGREPSMRG